MNGAAAVDGWVAAAHGHHRASCCAALCGVPAAPCMRVTARSMSGMRQLVVQCSCVDVVHVGCCPHVLSTRAMRHLSEWLIAVWFVFVCECLRILMALQFQYVMRGSITVAAFAMNESARKRELDSRAGGARKGDTVRQRPRTSRIPLGNTPQVRAIGSFRSRFWVIPRSHPAVHTVDSTC